MAYGNWGAFVFRNGERMRDHEDATPYKEKEYPSGYHQAFGILGIVIGPDGAAVPVKKPDGELRCQHASLGDGRVRLCGYKCYPLLFLDGCEVDIERFRVGDDGSEEYSAYAGTVEGHDFRAERRENFVELYMKSPDGAAWTSTCGFEYGAGHMEDSR